MDEGTYKGDAVVSIPVLRVTTREGRTEMTTIDIRLVDCDSAAVALERVKRAFEFIANNIHEIEGLL